MEKFVKSSGNLILTIGTLALCGCMSDAMTGDLAPPERYGSARYPITVAHTPHGAAAEVKPCGRWDEDLTATKENRGWSNLGCAVQHNIAAELDDPTTLDRPKTVPIKDGADGVAAVTREAARVNQVTLPSNYVFAK